MLRRNALLNLIGHAAPLAAALILVPLLVARLDAEHFGFLAIAWVLVGYFSLFDLGLGRALTWLVAERAGTSRADTIPLLARTALGLTGLLGVIVGGLLFVLAGPVCRDMLTLSPPLVEEAVDALRLLALCLPFVTLAAALRGLLEAGQRFGWVNAIRIPLGILTFGAPLAASLLSPSLVALAGALVALRIAACAAHWLVCAWLYPAWSRFGLPRGAETREMLGYGAWLTVSNVVGPLMVYIDRFVIGALLAVSAVAYYTAPYEVVTRLWIVPAALAGVLFPIFASAEPARLAALYRGGVKAIVILVLPLSLIAALFAPEWMNLWLGDEYARQGARVAQWLCLGVMGNCLAYLPIALLQARGRADLPAKAHLAELPFYLLSLWLLVPAQGIEGAAIAWTLRCAADAALLFLLARTRTEFGAPLFTKAQTGVILVALIALGGALLPFAFGAKVFYLALTLAAFGAAAWVVLLDPAERAWLQAPRKLPGSVQ